MENASRNYSYDEVRKLIKRQQKKFDWEFIFIGANIDAYKEANRFGIREDRAVNYVHDGRGTENLFEGVTMAIQAVMEAPSRKSVGKSLSESRWEEKIKADYEQRGKN